MPPRPHFLTGTGWRTMPCYDAASVAEMERQAGARWGLTPDTLMENAGAAAARHLLAHWPERTGFLVLAGPGNNGGDGLVAARYLARSGRNVTVLLHPKAQENPSPLFAANARRLAGLPVEITGSAPLSPDRPENALVLDAIYGTGFRGDLDPAALGLLRVWPGVSCVAFDMPSGVDATTGRASAGVRQAVATLQFGALKTGVLFEDGKNLCGDLVLLDISLPDAVAPVLLRAVEGPGGWEPAGRHKYENGRVCVVAGSAGMVGAAVYAARSAWKSGAGLVQLMAPAALLPALDALAPFAVKTPVGHSGDGHFSTGHLQEVVDLLEAKPGVLVAGPGAGSHPDTVRFYEQLLQQFRGPAVVDADALRAAAAAAPGVIRLLTPHAGELTRLTGLPVANDLDRLAAAQAAADRLGSVVLAKGNRTLMAAPGNIPVVLDYDTALFNRAGFGDVLAGAAGVGLLRESGAKEAALSAAFALRKVALQAGRPLLEPDDLLV